MTAYDPGSRSDMNSETSALEAAFPAPSGPRRTGTRGTLILLLVIAAFAGGVVAALWTAPAFNGWWRSANPSSDTAENGVAPAVDAVKPPVSASGAIAPDSVATLEARMAALSAQIDSISGQAAAAGGNAARAEGLLIAFAARRALDRGAPLGYLEGELRLRFGNAQPRAVATIISAAHAPVTLADLQAGLDEIAPALAGTQTRTDWWTATKRKLGSLIIIRKANAPSPAPRQAIERARTLLASDRAGAALSEIERLPNHAKAENWIQDAREYNEARRALDVIEAAAILEPRSVPVTPRAGGPINMQVAPPPPNGSKR